MKKVELTAFENINRGKAISKIGEDAKQNQNQQEEGSLQVYHVLLQVYHVLPRTVF